MTREELHQKNLNLAKKLYQRYCNLMEKKEDSKANTNLSMWFTMVEHILKSMPTEKENTQ